MSLVLALKNRNAIIVAGDTESGDDHLKFGHFMALPNRSVLLIAGNAKAVEASVTQILPKIDPKASTATVAQLVQAALILEVVPNLSTIKGRVEIIVAGFDPIRHVAEPGLYYMDSAQDFYLQVVQADAVAAGATAAVTSLLAGHSFADATIDQLRLLAKESLAATKLRWPGSVKSHIKIGTITPTVVHVQDY
jgi:20S proteasome alpha/beta subunit